MGPPVLGPSGGRRKGLTLLLSHAGAMITEFSGVFAPHALATRWLSSLWDVRACVSSGRRPLLFFPPGQGPLRVLAHCRSARVTFPICLASCCFTLCAHGVAPHFGVRFRSW